MRTIKNSINARSDENNLSEILNDFLIDYRNTKHCTTGYAPAELMLNFKPRHKLDFLKPSNLNKRKREILYTQKFFEGDRVMIRDYNFNKNKPCWAKATITKVIGPRNFICKMDTGRFIKRHINQMRKFIDNQECAEKHVKTKSANICSNDKKVICSNDKNVNKLNYKQFVCTKTFINKVPSENHSNNQSNINSNLNPNSNCRVLRDRANIVKPKKFDC